MKGHMGILTLLCWISLSGLESDPGIIKGTVKDKSGNPIKKAEITLASMEYISFNLKLATDKKGQFAQIDLEPGYYQIKARKEAYVPQAMEMRITSGQVIEASFELNESEMPFSEPAGENDFKEGNDWFLQEKYEEAAKSFQEAIVKEPDEAVYYNSLGIVYLSLGKIDEAIAVYKKMLEIQPRSYSANKMIGELYSLKNKDKLALSYFTSAAEVSPEDPVAYYNLGTCWMKMDASSRALEMFRIAIELKPDYPLAYYQVGMIYVQQSRKNDAIRNLEKFLELAPEDPDAPIAKKIIEFLKSTGR